VPTPKAHAPVVTAPPSSPRPSDAEPWPAGGPASRGPEPPTPAEGPSVTVREVHEHVERVERVLTEPVALEPVLQARVPEPSPAVTLAPVPAPKLERLVTDVLQSRPAERTAPAVEPAPVAAPPAPQVPPEHERRVQVRIGTIEINAADPTPAREPAAPPPSAPAPAEPPDGFERYARLRAYAPWEW
jgi:hypothetical protein